MATPRAFTVYVVVLLLVAGEGQGHDHGIKAGAPACGQALAFACSALQLHISMPAAR
jgi:hypothetical protein